LIGEPLKSARTILAAASIATSRPGSEVRRFCASTRPLAALAEPG